MAQSQDEGQPPPSAGQVSSQVCSQRDQKHICSPGCVDRLAGLFGGGAGDDKRKKGKSFLVVRNDILSGTRRCGRSRFCFRGHFLKEHPDCSQWGGNTGEGLEVGAGTQ